ARLADDSALRGEPWIVASELRHEARDALVLRAAPVDEARLRRDFGERFIERDEVRWDEARRALVAERVRRFDGIVLDVRPSGSVDPALAPQALTDAVAALGLDVLPWTGALRPWQARVQSLRAWMPDLGLPDVSDAALLATRAPWLAPREWWLRPLFGGASRPDALQAEAVGGALRSQLAWQLRLQLEALAPVRMVVRSGMERRVDCALAADGTPEPPLLAVKLQELF